MLRSTAGVALGYPVPPEKCCSCYRDVITSSIFALSTEKELQGLRLENMKTMFVSLVFLGAGYVVYYMFFHRWVPRNKRLSVRATFKSFQSTCTDIYIPHPIMGSHPASINPVSALFFVIGKQNVNHHIEQPCKCKCCMLYSGFTVVDCLNVRHIEWPHCMSSEKVVLEMPHFNEDWWGNRFVKS